MEEVSTYGDEENHEKVRYKTRIRKPIRLRELRDDIDR